MHSRELYAMVTSPFAWLFKIKVPLRKYTPVKKKKKTTNLFVGFGNISDLKISHIHKVRLKFNQAFH
jgi:hypothetical protein